jgi:hypothetical protein
MGFCLDNITLYCYMLYGWSTAHREWWIRYTTCSKVLVILDLGCDILFVVFVTWTSRGLTVWCVPRVCVCVCVWVGGCVCVCVCVCVCARFVKPFDIEV